MTHHREVVFVDQKFWVLFDTITGEGTHTVESRFQFGPGEIEVNGASAVTQFDDANLYLCATGSWESRVLKGEEDLRAGWYSASYNKIEPAPALSLTNETALPLSNAVLLFPYPSKQNPVTSFTLDTAARISLSDGSKYDVPASS